MKTTDKQALGLKFKYLRRLFKYTQQEFSKKLGITRSSISLLESGERQMSANELLIISDNFGIGMRDFMVMDLNGIIAQYKQVIDIEELKYYLK